MTNEQCIRAIAKQDQAGEVDDSYLRTHDEEDTIRRWRASAASAGDNRLVDAIDQLGISGAAALYEAARS